MSSLYYQLRGQKRLDKHMKSVEAKIEQKMEEIRRGHRQHREKLIKQGDLIDDEREDTKFKGEVSTNTRKEITNQQ